MADEEDRAARFLVAFQRIEAHLRRATSAPDEEGFSAVLHRAVEQRSSARHFQYELLQLAALRNAIVHRPPRDGRPVADPRPDVVKRIEEIAAALLTVPALLAVLAHGVTVTHSSEPARDAAARMFAGDYSQLPVLSHGLVADILTSDALSRWMTGQLLETGSVPFDTPVSEVLPFDADRTFEVVGPKTDVLQALDLFSDREARGQMLHAIIVAKRPPAGSLVAIATISDLPSLLSAAQPYRSVG